MNVYPVIMCGGAGTRLWPLSRNAAPKQFHPLISEQDLLTQTLTRLSLGAAFCTLQPPIIICAEKQESQVRASCQAAGITPGMLVLEPTGRNTAPLAAVSAALVAETDPNGIVLLLPADHHISQPQQLWQHICTGLEVASSGRIVTFGITPTKPETGYGYIRQGTPLCTGAWEVDQFTEKPDLPTAKRYLASGEYFWNAGVFLFQASNLLAEMQALAPKILTASNAALHKAQRTNGKVYLDESCFSVCPAIPFDIAIMEKTSKAALIAPVCVGWSDIGSWASLAELAAKDAEGMHCRGDVVQIGCTNAYLHTDGPLIAAIGIENIVVVATKDAVLISHIEKTQEVKEIVATLTARNRSNLL